MADKPDLDLSLLKTMALEICILTNGIDNMNFLKDMRNILNMLHKTINERISILENKPSPNQIPLLSEDEES